MFDLGILQTSLGITNQFEGFLGELWTVWTRDVGRAVLLARWFWQKIPQSVVQRAAAMNQQAQAAQSAQAIDQQVNVQLGALGIFPANTGGTLFGGSVMDPNVAMFLQVMAMIRAYQGEPPMGTTSPGMALAEAVLRGQRDPVEVMIEAAAPAQKQQLTALVQLAKMSGFAGFYSFIQIEAAVLAAFALPRERIPVFMPDLKKEIQTERGELEKKAVQSLGMTQRTTVPGINLDDRADGIVGRVRKIIIEQLGVEEREVTPNASFVDDLGADDIDAAELRMAFQDAFGIQIPDEDAENIRTVQDAIDYITKHSETRKVRADLGMTPDRGVSNLPEVKKAEEVNFAPWDTELHRSLMKTGLKGQQDELGKEAASNLNAMLVGNRMFFKDIDWVVPSVRLRLLQYSKLADSKDGEYLMRTVQIQLGSLLQERGRDVSAVDTRDINALERVARQEGVWEWTEAVIGQRRFSALFRQYAAAANKSDHQIMASTLTKIKDRLTDVLWARGKDASGVNSVNIETLEKIVREEGLYE